MLPALLLADDHLRPPPKVQPDRFHPPYQPWVATAPAQALPPPAAPTPAPAPPPAPVAPTPAVVGPVSVSTSPVSEGTAIVEPLNPERRRVQVWLAARDPFSVIAFWELEDAERTSAQERDPAGSWRLRVFANGVDGPQVADQPLPSVPERRVPVWFAGTRYVAEIGFLNSAGDWQSRAVSVPESTPPDGYASDWSNRREVFRPPSQPAQSSPAVRPETSVAEPQTHGDESVFLPLDTDLRPHLEAAEELVRLVEDPLAEPVSADSAELARWQLRNWRSSVKKPAVDGLPSSPEITHPTGLMSRIEAPGSTELTGLGRRPPSFWFDINAEVVVYGGTEPDARVSIAGRTIKLRSDGTFSFRFALPDGQFELPAIAVNAAGDDQRAARLTLSRTTKLEGDVGCHAQDPQLLPPTAEAIA